jgi:hypothetical protein
MTKAFLVTMINVSDSGGREKINLTGCIYGRRNYFERSDTWSTIDSSMIRHS